MTLRLKVLSDNQCRQFHEASVEVLSQTGVRFFKQEAVDLLKFHGAKVDGNLVRIPAELLEKCLESCPKRFKWKGFGEHVSIQVQREPHIQPAVGPVFIQDMENGRRPAEPEDYKNVIKLMNALDVVSINGGMPVDVAGLASEKRYLYMMETMLRHTDKPLVGFCLNERLVHQTLGVFEAAAEDEKIWEKGHYLAAVCTLLSPLAMDEDTVDTLMAYASRNQIVMSTSCLMAGISGPVSPLMTAVLQNAEILSGLVLSQCVRPGCPVLYSAASSAGYMRDASFAGGSPDAMLIHGACIQAAIDLYDLPIRIMTGINSAKQVDYQAGMETGMSALLAGLIGGGVWSQCLGVLDDIMTLSYEKLILDQDTFSRSLHVRKGLTTLGDSISGNLIGEVGPQGNYLMHPDTFKNFSSLWIPTSMNWESWGSWQKHGGQSLLEKANQAYKRMLAESPDTLLSSDQEKALARAVERHTL